GQPLKPRNAVSAVAFRPDGQTALTGSTDKTARLRAVVPPAVDDPEKLRLSVEVRTRFYLDDQGIRRELTQDQWLARRKKLDKFYDVRSWDEVSEEEKRQLRTPRKLP